jgi:hypothetical protein
MQNPVIFFFPRRIFLLNIALLPFRPIQPDMIGRDFGRND